MAAGRVVGVLTHIKYAIEINAASVTRGGHMVSCYCGVATQVECGTFADVDTPAVGRGVVVAESTAAKSGFIGVKIEASTISGFIVVYGTTIH